MNFNMRLNIKKLLLLTFAASQMAVFGQYQLPNPGFEAWAGDQNSKPAYWNGFPTGDCQLTGFEALGCNTARDRRHQRSDSRPGSLGQYSIKLFSTAALGIVANGNLTTGRIVMGSATATSSSNYNYTICSDANYSQLFTGRPDSVRFWAKLNVANHATTQARISAVLHGNVNYKDPNDGATGRMGHAAYNFSCPDKNWHQYSYPFSYDNSTTPSYILVTLTTNATPGGGKSGDEVFFDDIEMIYNIHLNDLKIAGTTVGGFHRDTLNYKYYLCTGDAIPAIAYTGSSPRANIQTDHNNLITTITVGNTGWHADSTRDYTVQFIYRDVVQAPAVTNISLCGQGQTANLSATTGTNGTICRWYSGNMLLHTGLSYTLNNCTKDTTLYVTSYNEITGCESNKAPITVTVRPVPNAPVIVGDTICGAGLFSLSATYGTNGTSCRWYASNTASNVLFAGNLHAGNTNKDTSFWVSSYNATTTCESERVEVKVIVNAVPQIPAVKDTALCGGKEITLSVQEPKTGIEYIWYSSDNTPLDTANTYTRTFTETTIIKVSSLNILTGCESEKAQITINVSPVPNAPVVVGDTICEADLFSLSATHGTNGTSCRWYASSTASNVLFAGNLHAGNTNKDTSFWVSSYNATTICESERVEVKVIVNAVPQIPIVSDTVLCGSEEITLNVHQPETGIEYIWYSSNNIPLDTVSAYTQTFTETTTLNVLSHHPLTGCKSEKTQITITINPIPEVPLIAITDYCHEGELIITPQIGNDGNSINWYDAATERNVLKTSLMDTLRNITAPYSSTFYISSVNTTTLCESERQELTINIHPVYNIILNDTNACNSFIWNDSIYTQTGNYTQTFQTTYGCDSIVSQFVTVHFSFKETIFDTICLGATYQKHGFNFNPSYPGTHNDTLFGTTVYGCDSNIMLQLTVHPTYHPDTVKVTICESGSYNFFGKILTEEGIYDTLIKTIHGCDSLVVLNLIVSDAFIETLNITVCHGDTYFFKGEYKDRTGTYYDTLIASNNCDSIIILNLTIRDEILPTSFMANTCSYYVWNDSTYTQSTVHTIVFSAANGCDSVVTMNLTIRQPAMYQFNDTACVSYIWNEKTYITSGIYKDTLKAANGCDSIVTLHLLINKLATYTFNHTACVSYQWKGNTYTQSTTIRDTLIGGANNGCDSITILNLTVNQPTMNVFNDTACGFYQWKGNTYTQSTTIRDTLIGGASNGCDSITVFNLTINLPTMNVFNDTACGFYQWRGNTYTQSTTLKDTLIANNGCDSIITLHLIINQVGTYAFNHTACGSYLWKGNIYTQSTTLRDTLVGGANNGCDSIITLNLTVNQLPEIVHLYDTACISYLWHGKTYTTSGDYDDTLSAVNACDSIISLHLVVNYPMETVNIYDTTCQGEVYTENGFDLPSQNISGNHIYNLIVNCDTTRLYLTVNRTYPSREFSQTACDSYTWNDSTYYETGEYVQSFQTIYGCDSIVTLKLTINSSSEPSYITDAICQGEAYTENGFDLPAQKNAGIFEYTVNLGNSDGCDSITHLTLTVYPTGEFQIQDTVFMGETYTKHGFNITPDVVGIYRDTLYLTSSHGCDSTVNLLLFALNETSISELDNMKEKVYLFPNPAQHQITISASENIRQIRFYDNNGKLLNSIYPSNEMQIICDINHYAKGIYFVEIQTENGICTKKLKVEN